MTAPIDITGQRYGRLTALERLDGEYWRCVCDCGRETRRRFTLLRSKGEHQSCGCTSYVPVKFAIMYDGELRPITEIAQLSGVATSILYKARTRGELSEEWIKSYLHRQGLLRTARELGITSDLLAYRRRTVGECDAIYTTPKNEARANKGRLLTFRSLMVTVKEISQATGLSPQAVRKRIRNGHSLEAPKMDRRTAGGVRGPVR